MPQENPVNPPMLVSGTSALAQVREWLMDGGNPNILVDGSPLPLWLLEQDAPQAVPEAWAAGADPNGRDAMGRGWLHRALVLGVPGWLAMEGFRRLDRTWWHPDVDGATPLHLPVPDTRLAQAMMARWWGEHRPRSLLARPFDPLESTLPQAAAWRAWKDLLRP